MDLGTLFMFCLISLVIGAVLMLIVQYYIYVRFCNLPTASTEQKYFNEKYTLPEDLRKSTSKFDPESKSPLMAINLVMQFLFHELKHTSRVRKWFYRKLSLELDELVQKTTTGKLFDKLTLKDLGIGDQFPEIKLLRVHDVEINESEGRINNLDLLLELKYNGNFRIAVDADMVLGKKASLTLKVRHLAGLARLQFTRKPYTHWSLSFLGDPDLDLAIESKFQGRQMQSNISALISNQIRRAVRRKHTLPKYKLRYKPFFHKTDEDYDGDIQSNGTLAIKVSELSRLRITNQKITDVYCTLTLGSIPWVEVKQKDETNVGVSIDIEIHKAKNQQIGILFKQSEKAVEIEAVLPNTPAIKSSLKAGDVLISIEGVQANSIQQVAKIVKGLNKTVIVLRIERIIPGVIQDDINIEDTDVYEDLGEPKLQSQPSSLTNELSAHSMASTALSFRQPRSNSSGESSISSTPTNSPKRSKFISRALKKNQSKESSEDRADISRTSSISRLRGRDDNLSPSSSSSQREPPDMETYQQHTTILCPIDQLIHMDDRCHFNLDVNCKYLNICVYGKSAVDKTLLGFLNISMKNLIGECSETSLIETVKTYSLDPPTTNDLKTNLASLSGFNPNLCFGDILLAFMWEGNPIQSDASKKPSKTKAASDKGEETEKSETTAPKAHNFIRTHFHRATQCDFCGKKIWLKDAVQCRDCFMSCHKKCVTKCQNSTVCGPVDFSSVINPTGILQPEFTLTEAPPNSAYDSPHEDEQNFEKPSPESGHRQSLTGLIAQGLKRVNSANNLSIPGISPSAGQNSRSLPPSPQHSPRKQSLVSLGVSPFVAVTQILETIPSHVEELTNDHIESITEPIISMGRDHDVMTMAKEASKGLFNEISGSERVDKINSLLTKLRLALDIETANHSRLLEANPNENSIIRSSSIDNPRAASSTDRPPETDAVTPQDSKELMARRSFELGKSDERVQALSVIMLYLCTGLQHAQGVASQ